ncbi:cysteine dioxygenase [Caulobacter sp. 1776]|uniref:cysteine dioxygenase family protein n=1 Tax=Caulobacter sp. 1776 TaxID=3156420 RepID=UPI003391A389
MSQHCPHRLSDFVADLSALLDRTRDEAAILREGAALLADLVGQDDWLPEAQSQPDPARYQQYLLHRDPAGRFSVVSFVWGPGQATPVHDHTVWGLVGVLRGAEISQAYVRSEDGLKAAGSVHRLEPGQVEAVSPTIGDIHRVANAFDDRTSISIHVYGADIGAVRRSTYDADGRPKTFISGYADVPPPLLFDRASALAYGAAE